MRLFVFSPFVTHPAGTRLAAIRLTVMRGVVLLSSLLMLMLVAPADAAEVLQVRTSSLLQVGDHNRTYTVQLACVDVTAEAESEAVGWLRQQLPRRRRVNLRPVGSRDGQLLARVTPLGDSTDLSTGLVAAGLAGNSCTAGSA